VLKLEEMLIEDPELLKIVTASPAAKVELGIVIVPVAIMHLPRSLVASVVLLDCGRPKKPIAFVPSTVQLLSVPLAGVPSVGLVKVGELSVALLARTTLPEPVEVVEPVPPLVTASVPVT
jgi:hypothetical protein